jgi:hypothetical protein
MIQIRKTPLVAAMVNIFTLSHKWTTAKSLDHSVLSSQLYKVETDPPWFDMPFERPPIFSRHYGIAANYKWFLDFCEM